MASQSQKNADAIIELDKKVALLGKEILIIKDNHLQHLDEKISHVHKDVEALEKSVNQLYKLAVGFALMLAVIFAETVQSILGMIMYVILDYAQSGYECKDIPVVYAIKKKILLNFIVTIRIVRIQLLMLVKNVNKRSCKNAIQKVTRLGLGVD